MARALVEVHFRSADCFPFSNGHVSCLMCTAPPCSVAVVAAVGLTTPRVKFLFAYKTTRPSS